MASAATTYSLLVLVLLSFSGSGVHAALGRSAGDPICQRAQVAAANCIRQPGPGFGDHQRDVRLYDFDVNTNLEFVERRGVLLPFATTDSFTFTVAASPGDRGAVWRYTPDPDDRYVAPFNLEAWNDAAAFRSRALAHASHDAEDPLHVGLPDGTSDLMPQQLSVAASIGVMTLILFGLFRGLSAA